MQCEWCIARYQGEEMKRYMGLAYEGVGYFILESDKHSCLLAFLRPLDRPRPDHLEVVRDMFMIEKLEQRRKDRMGIR